MLNKPILNEFQRQVDYQPKVVLPVAILFILGSLSLSDAGSQVWAVSANSNSQSETKTNDASSTQIRRQESPAPSNSSPPNPDKSAPGIPPELLRQIQKLPEQPQAVVVTIPRLDTIGRLLLLLVALTVLFASIITCRFIHRQNYFGDQNSIFLMLGLFGAIAALIIAAACVGSLFLHLAAIICTMISGFCLMAFLFPQFDLTRQWVTGTPEPSDVNIQDSKIKKLSGDPESEGEPL